MIERGIFGMMEAVLDERYQELKRFRLLAMVFSGIDALTNHEKRF